MCIFTNTKGSPLRLVIGRLHFWCLQKTSASRHSLLNMVIQEHRRRMWPLEINANTSPALRESNGCDVVTQRKVGTCQGQQSPQCCSWLFPGLDLQPWVTCPVDTTKGNQCQTHIVFKYITVHTLGICVCMSNAISCKALYCMSVCYREDFCLAGVGMCVLFPSWLGVVLILPLGPDLTGATLELCATLTALPRHIWTLI